MARILVTPEELRQSASLFATNSQQTSEMISTLTSEVHNLSSVWEGASQSAFFESFEALVPTLQQFVEILEGINQQLTAVADTIEETDNQIASSLRG